jgi:hypothetical protein
MFKIHYQTFSNQILFDEIFLKPNLTHVVLINSIFEKINFGNY